MPFRPTNGFMEPTRHVTYYEDTRTQVQDEHDLIEARTFDLCEDSSEEDGDNSQPKHKRKNAQHITSYGSIRKPTYKSRVEPNQQPAYKIAPNRNSRHSIRLFESSYEDEHSEHLDGPTTQSKNLQSPTNSSAQAFAEEKARQHQLSGQARFDNVRKKRAADRLRLHNACQKARKTKERALRDTEAAAACLVDAVPTSDSYIQIEVDSSEVPSDFVDLTREDTRREKSKQVAKSWPPQNWKSENMKLDTGVAYVLIMDRE